MLVEQQKSNELFIGGESHLYYLTVMRDAQNHRKLNLETLLLQHHQLKYFGQHHEVGLRDDDHLNIGGTVQPPPG